MPAGSYCSYSSSHKSKNFPAHFATLALSITWDRAAGRSRALRAERVDKLWAVVALFLCCIATGLVLSPGFPPGGKMSARKLRYLVMALCLAGPLAAGPILTTIQDVIYNANGTPYNGFAVIKWTPFVAGDTTQIATQSVTVNIIGGNLMVQLVPTTNATPAGYYTVTLTSSGNDQFIESWSVPPSTKPLRVQDVMM